MVATGITTDVFVCFREVNSVSEQFLKIKKKHMTAAIVASAVFGVCAALVVVGILLLCFKLCGVKFHPALYLPVALGVMALAGGLFFFFVRPRDKALAKKLDESYDLGEKVQTMIEYAHSDDAMAVLQREHANETLSNLRPKKIKATQIVKLAVVPVLALALFFTGTFVPARKADAGNEDPAWNPTERQIILLTELIDEVNASRLDDTLIDGIDVVLNNLLAGLENELTQGEMRSSVISSVVMIDSMISSANSAIAVTQNLNSSDRVKTFSNACSSAAFYYRNDGIRLTDFASVGAKLERAEQAIPEMLRDAAKKIKDPWQEITLDEIKAELTAFGAELSPFAQANVPETDGLYVAVKALRDEIGVIVENIESGGYPAENILAQIDDAFTVFSAKASPALAMQSYNTSMNAYIRARLAAIFGISASDFPPIKLPEGMTDSGSSSGDDDENNNTGGAPGDEEQIRGGDGMIYDPVTEKYRPYGEVLKDYDAKMTEYVRSGDISEEAIKFITAYFDILTSSYNNKGDQGAN